jgi:GntR family transcriptional repressor for pyruvate dehydrogenase complex
LGRPIFLDIVSIAALRNQAISVYIPSMNEPMLKTQASPQPIRDSFEMPASIRQRSDEEAREIVAAVKNSIANGRLRPGARLPPETALCDQYGASRHTVRKAMTLLEREGLLMRRVGRGSFILDATSNTDPAPSWHPPEGRAWTLTELTEARLVIEPQLAAMIIERADADDFHAMAKAIAAIDSATDWPSFKEAKYAFHLAVVRAAKNDFLVCVFEQIIASRRRAAWSRHRGVAIEIEGTKAVCVAESQAILDALRRRDLPGVEEAIRKSLIRILVAISEL